MAAINAEIISRIFGGVLILVGLTLGFASIWAWWTTDDWSYLFGEIFALTLIGTGWAKSFPSEPPPLALPPDEPLIVIAGEQARRDIQKLLNGLDNGRLEPYVKISMANVEGELEHLWAIVHAVSGKKALTVSIVSDPVGELDTSEIRHTVKVADIEDWMLIDSAGQIEGAYTEVAMAHIYEREKGYIPYAIRKRLTNISNFDRRPRM